MTDCDYFLLYLALDKLSLMLLINYSKQYVHLYCGKIKILTNFMKLSKI